MKKASLIAGIVLGTSIFASQASAATYTVKSGDTLSKIAQAHGTSVSSVMDRNNLNSTLIFPGQVFNVGGTAVKSASTTIPSSASSSSIINSAEKYLGARYQYGASPSRTDVFDCSSFTQRVFAEQGIMLPRNSAAQSGVGTSVSLSNLQPGDLIFFATSGTGRVSHVGIYAGGGKMISAQNGGVKYADINNSYWGPRTLFAKRAR